MDNSTPEQGMPETMTCVCKELRMATRAVTQVYDTHLSPSGLKVGQFTILSILSRCGTTTINQLADSLVMDRTTLTRNLKPLIKQKMVDLRPGDDRRTRVVGLTGRGQHAMDSAIPLWREAQDSIVSKLGEKNYKSLLAGLTAAVRAAQAQDAGARAPAPK